MHTWWEKEAKESLLAAEERTSLLVQKSIGLDFMWARNNILQSKNFFFFLIFLTELLEPEKMSNLMKRCSEHTDNLEACLGT